jgi:hypothetical protein
VETSMGVFVLTGIILSALVYWLVIRPWHLKWGATGAELQASMPGDDVIAEPHCVATRSVTIHAQVEDVWPWLAQMGYERAGLYAYDWIGRWRGTLAGPSATHIVPKFQALRVGGLVPRGSAPSWRVKGLEPNRFLVVHVRETGREQTRAWELHELDESHTRLVLRIRSRWTRPSPFPLFHFMEAGSFLMTRKHLLGIRQRAEIGAWQTEEWMGTGLGEASWLPSAPLDRQQRTSP